MGRQAVWSDPQVIEHAKAFVPAADEVGRLQRGTETDGRFFLKIAEQGHYGGRPGHSRQGIYAATPGGLLLGSLNTSDPRRVAALLEDALARWEALSQTERLRDAPPDEAFADLRRAERFYPEDGLVLCVYSRDLPRDEAAEGDPEAAEGWLTRAWNQEFAWFTKAEARRFVPDVPVIGQTYSVPHPLVSRLVRCHLLDNVQGETTPFAEEDIRSARLLCRVTDVSDDAVRLTLEGDSRTDVSGSWCIHGLPDNTPTPQRRGFDCRMAGAATWDREREAFTAFDLVAIGTRWGGTRYNVRADDLHPAPMGVAFSLAGRSPSERVAPAHFRDYGWEPG